METSVLRSRLHVTVTAQIAKITHHTPLIVIDTQCTPLLSDFADLELPYLFLFYSFKELNMKIRLRQYSTISILSVVQAMQTSPTGTMIYSKVGQV
jgi:hypothetical protein